MKRRERCAVCGKRLTLRKRGVLPGHHYAASGLVVVVQPCPGSGKQVTA